MSTWLGSDEFSSDMDAVIQVFSEYGESVDNYKTLATRQVFGKDLEQEEMALNGYLIWSIPTHSKIHLQLKPVS